MTTLNLNFENYTDFEYKQGVVQKIVQSFLQKPEIYQKSCLNGLKYKELSIDFVFCDDKFIHKINKEYRGKDKPTDVISFALYCDDPDSVKTEEISLGEIIVSVDTAQRQAKENGHSTEQEIYYLISHGVLHLLGFDHISDEEYNFMVEKQTQVMKELGYVKI